MYETEKKRIEKCEPYGDTSNSPGSLSRLLGGFLDIPYFSVTVLSGRNKGLIVEPNQTSDLGLRVSICKQSNAVHANRLVFDQVNKLTFDDGMLRGAGNVPNDDGSVERTTCY